jgi:hypothetical protein
MAKQLRGPLEKFVDFRQCAAVVLLCLPLHNRITAAHCCQPTDFSNDPRIFEIDVFWVVTPCGVVVGYQTFRGPCCLHFHGEVT